MSLSSLSEAWRLFCPARFRSGDDAFFSTRVEVLDCNGKSPVSVVWITVWFASHLATIHAVTAHCQHAKADVRCIENVRELAPAGLC